MLLLKSDTLGICARWALCYSVAIQMDGLAHRGMLWVAHIHCVYGSFLVKVDGASAPTAERWDFQWRWVALLTDRVEEMLAFLNIWVGMQM